MTSEPTWKKQGFKSPRNYQDHLAKQRGFKSISDYEVHLAKQKGFKTLHEYHKQLGLIEKYDKQKLCKSLQKLTNNIKDPESLFSDIEFVREISGCKIPTKKRNNKNI